MTTPAKKALDEIGKFKPKTIDTLGELIKMAAWAYRNISTIRAALKVLDEVQRYPVSSGSTWNDAVAHTINHLKQIAGE